MPEYTNRTLTEYTVKSNEPYENHDTCSILTTYSTGFGVSKAVGARIPEGTVFELETIGFSQITGLKLGDEWLFRKSDEDMAADHEKFVADLKADRVAKLAANRVTYVEREMLLPHWLQARLINFHDKGGVNFEEEGWGYELAIAELAALMASHSVQEITDDKMEDVSALASNLGVSGNQYGFARALAMSHLEGADDKIAESVSALSPITGDAFYEKDID